MKYGFRLLALMALAACSQQVEHSADTTRRDTATTPTATPPSPTPQSPTPQSPTPQSPKPPTSYVVTERGIGPLHAGMTTAEAAKALDGALSAPKNGDCTYLTWRGSPAKIRVMAEQNRIARIEVDSSNVATDAGARVGDSEEHVKSLYAGRFKVTPHKYTDGHYITITPQSPADSMFRLVFETEKGRVTTYRAGQRPQVEYVEGCA